MSKIVQMFKDILENVGENNELINGMVELLELPDGLVEKGYVKILSDVRETLATPEIQFSLGQTIAENTLPEDWDFALLSIKELLDSKENDLTPSKTLMMKELIDIIIFAIEDATLEVHTVKIELIHENAKIPTYARRGDAGADLYAAEDTTIKKGEKTLIHTGIKVAVPYGYEMQIRPRSGLSLKTGLRISNAPGTIDSGYRGEICVIMENVEGDFTIKAGDRIAQAVLSKVPVMKFSQVESIESINGNRGGGFGHSGE